jgi:hypothetical protein
LFKALIRQISQITFSLETFIYREKKREQKKEQRPHAAHQRKNARK